MSRFVEGLLTGMGAAGWVIGFVVVLGTIMIAMGAIWAIFTHVISKIEDEKEAE